MESIARKVNVTGVNLTSDEQVMTQNDETQRLERMEMMLERMEARINQQSKDQTVMKARKRTYRPYTHTSMQML